MCDGFWHVGTGVVVVVQASVSHRRRAVAHLSGGEILDVVAKGKGMKCMQARGDGCGGERWWAAAVAAAAGGGGAWPRSRQQVLAVRSPSEATSGSHGAHVF